MTEICKRISSFMLLLMISCIIIAQEQPLKEKNLYVKGVLKKSVAIKSSPGGGTSEGTLKELDIVYIYEKTKSGYYKVGYNAKGSIGYVAKHDVQLWNTRICLHFTPIAGRKPALVFDSSDALENCLRGSEDFYDSANVPNSNAIAQEPDDEKQVERLGMLLPVLKSKRSRVGSSGNRIYNVGFLAGGDAPEAHATSTTFSSKKRSASEIVELELMFLLDATYSMRPFINATKDIIENVTQRLIKTREGGLRFGVTAYRDYIDNQSEMEFITQQFIDLTPNSREVIRILGDVYEADVDSEEPAEAVFDGYFAAITETGWKDKPNTLRIVILIGDASSHLPGSAKNPLNYSGDLLLQKASDKRVRTIAVKINSGRTDDDELSKSQFFAIAEGLSKADKGHFIEVDYPVDGDPVEFIKKTSAKIEAEIHRQEKFAKTIAITPTGSDEIKYAPGTTSTDRAIIMKNIKIEKGSTEPFVFSTGWISESVDDKRSVQAYIYMTKNEFDLMTEYLRLVDQVIKTPEYALNGMMKEVIESVTGETLEGKNLGDHYKKTLGIPIKTDILKIPFEELDSWGEDRKQRMIDLIKGKMNSIETWDVALDKWHNIPGGGSEKYTFIPIEMLP